MRLVGAEPDMSAALAWWSELPGKWTPIGWKDHLFRFNVLFNGMLSAVPDLNSRSKAWAGQGMHLGVFPTESPDFPRWVSEPHDNNSVLQSWSDCEAPVLRSEWARDGLVLRQEVFAHVIGGCPVRTGTEPLFAWMRLSIADFVEGLPLPDNYGFSLKINAPYIRVGSMSIRYNLAFAVDESAYPRALSPDAGLDDPSSGLRIVEPDGNIRLAVAPGGHISVRFLPGTPSPRDFLLHLGIPVVRGSAVDVLVPMLPTEPEILDAELALGYDAALAEAENFWSAKPTAAAMFDTPEPHINNTIARNIQISEIVAEKDPSTGYYTMLTGSWRYSDLWATPGCMNYIMLLDTMGYHDVVEKYMRVFVDQQGQAVPTGDFYRHHPGSFSTPRHACPVDWTSDHGAILWALAEHALLAGDTAFVREAADAVVKGCDFIRFCRRIDDHGGVPGLMPPGIATDMPTRIQSVWADAWNFKGLSTAARWLRLIGHRCASEFEAEAQDYRDTFVRALRESARSLPEWTDAGGVRRRVAPMAVHGAEPFEYRNAFYLDTGPLVLVFAGLLEAGDEMMRSALEWFREGPPARVYRYDSDCWQVPSLCREMSSCEPCYSWNVFHSHQTGDRARFLEGMYSLFAGSVSRQTYTVCETRGGVTGLTAAALPAYMARLAVIDDQLDPEELRLLRLAPAAWLRPDREACFENMPTEFGPITLRAGLGEDGSRLRVAFEPRFRRLPRTVWLHVPPIANLGSVTVNGRTIDWELGCECIKLRY